MKDHYSNLFLSEQSGNSKLTLAALSSTIFDPIFLKGKENDILTLYFYADQLPYLGYGALSPQFIAFLKKEIRKVLW